MRVATSVSLGARGTPSSRAMRGRGSTSASPAADVLSYHPAGGVPTMGGKEKPAFSCLNAGCPSAPGPDPVSAREARRNELLGAALERQPQLLRLGAGALPEGHRDHQAVDADPHLGGVDPDRVDAAPVG